MEYMNEDEFAEKLDALMNCEKLEGMSAKAHARSKDFKVDKIVNEWMCKYTQLLESKILKK